ncbi:MAG: hypothetical protein JW870_17545 [Candidatus Delongbacteria bacterium]|nr:hypothetical protein [Candidatus Delongbacteria bacterium]
MIEDGSHVAGACKKNSEIQPELNDQERKFCGQGIEKVGAIYNLNLMIKKRSHVFMVSRNSGMERFRTIILDESYITEVCQIM